MISCCGINCGECDAFIATKENDDEKRSEVAKLWSKQFNSDIKPESINCVGCLSESGPVFGYCEICSIRKCAKAKEIPNCAHCSEYACDSLEGLFKMLPECKENLEKIKQTL